MTSFEPGVKSLHVRNEDYWRETANFDAIEITAITDPQARVNALIAGDMHMISDVDAKMIKLIESSNTVMSIPQNLEDMVVFVFLKIQLQEIMLILSRVCN